MQWLKNKYVVMLSYLFDLTPYDYFSCSRIIKDKKKKNINATITFQSYKQS